jgi:UPF0176 protein
LQALLKLAQEISMKQYYNKVNKEELKKKLHESGEKRMTISFYKYHNIKNTQIFRNYIYEHFFDFGVFGRIYIATEGINAQISIPFAQFAHFEEFLDTISFLKGNRLNIAVEDDNKSFYVLKVLVKNNIVADGLENSEFDMSKRGKYLKAKEFNTLAEDPDTIIVDMRNHYESEVGHFKNAWCPDVDTFKEQLPLVANELDNKKDKPIIMYCTGGIRCEKASAYMRYKGFEDVYHVEGGIIKYARDVKNQGLENKYIGKNFVFDERLEEAITDDVIATCHQCETSFDHHSNCNNKACNLLFIQCPECATKYDGCCSAECQEIYALPEVEQAKIRKGQDSGVRIFSKGRFQNKSQSE